MQENPSPACGGKIPAKIPAHFTAASHSAERAAPYWFPLHRKPVMSDQTPYPGGITGRFTLTACLGILLAALTLLPFIGAGTRETVVFSGTATLLYLVPAMLSGVCLARCRAYADPRGLLLAAASGVCVWGAVLIAFMLMTGTRPNSTAIMYPAAFLALLHAVAALITLPRENSPTLHAAFKHGGADSATLTPHPHRKTRMENTTQKLILIAVISAILLIAVQLLSGLINDREHYAADARERVSQVDSPSRAAQTLDNRLDLYRLTERSSKYAVLFLLITFGGCFLFETLRGLRIHPVQYFLVGAAVCVFYLLLLSLGEYLGFAAAYALAALACNGLITGYLSAVLGSAPRALTLGGILALAYAVLYLLLQSREYTLLAGSLLLFAALAATMYGTRHFDWYNLKAKKED